jgi:response regulator RpfG family c-di-GMP phosphodiesterase
VKKGRVFYLEDDPDWLEIVQRLLAGDYDLYSASSQEEAATLFWEMASDRLEVDVAVIDVSLVYGDAHDKQGFKFIDALNNSGVMRGDTIIVLSGYSDIDENLRVAFRDYHVDDVFDKGTLVEHQEEFKERIDKIIERQRG